MHNIVYVEKIGEPGNKATQYLSLKDSYSPTTTILASLPPVSCIPTMFDGDCSAGVAPKPLPTSVDVETTQVNIKFYSLLTEQNEKCYT